MGAGSVGLAEGIGSRRFVRIGRVLLAFTLAVSLLSACSFLALAPRRTSLVGEWTRSWATGKHVSRLILDNDGTFHAEHMPIGIVSYGFGDLSWPQTVSGGGTWRGPEGSTGDFTVSISFDSRIFQNVKLHWRVSDGRSQLVGFYGNTEGDDEFVYEKQRSSAD